MRTADELWREYRVRRGYALEKMRALATALGHGELLRLVGEAERDGAFSRCDARTSANHFRTPTGGITA